MKSLQEITDIIFKGGELEPEDVKEILWGYPGQTDELFFVDYGEEMVEHSRWEVTKAKYKGIVDKANDREGIFRFHVYEGATEMQETYYEAKYTEVVEEKKVVTSFVNKEDRGKKGYLVEIEANWADEIDFASRKLFVPSNYEKDDKYRKHTIALFDIIEEENMLEKYAWILDDAIEIYLTKKIVFDYLTEEEKKMSWTGHPFYCLLDYMEPYISQDFTLCVGTNQFIETSTTGTNIEVSVIELEPYQLEEELISDIGYNAGTHADQYMNKIEESIEELICKAEEPKRKVEIAKYVNMWRDELKEREERERDEV